MMPISVVHEVQGLYGPFSISEKVIQKIWFRRDFYQEDLRTSSGKCLRVLDPGRWNTNEGPDFLAAHLEIDGEEQVGDVEIHFHASDWCAHGHDQNSNFDRVILHVLLYGHELKAEHQRPGQMESLVLLPLLERDLEEYAMEAALLDLEQVNELEWFELFMAKPLAERRLLLEQLAKGRWQQKCNYAEKRLRRTDWASCCHESTLEVLGLARNRGVMHQIAARYTLADFSRGLDPEHLYASFSGGWKLSGCRPANHPKLRLQQYSALCRANPDWPQKLLESLHQAPLLHVQSPTEFRKNVVSKALQRCLSDDVFQGIIGSKRLNTLLCDGIFPLAALALDPSWAFYWQHWYPGDFPDAFTRFYRQAGLADASLPMSNGSMQGILALFASQGQALYAAD
ncbi:MAG: DUF2851 family protein [Opitutales bacterium]